MVKLNMQKAVEMKYRALENLGKKKNEKERERTRKKRQRKDEVENETAARAKRRRSGSDMVAYLRGKNDLM